MGWEELGILATVVGTAIAVFKYLRRDNSPEVEDNSQTLTAGDGSQNYQAGRDVIVQGAPVADASPEPPASSITIKFKAEGHSHQGWDYHLEVSFKNLSERTFEEYRVEIEVPLFLLTPGTDYTTEVKQRRTDSRAFFRTFMTDPNMPAVYPGDSPVAWTMGVHKDEPIEATDLEASETIAATLYVNDQRTCKEELKIRDLLA